ncbi:cytochrome c family protein [Enhygromyxa salina]|uniref:Cytochrome c family protein n=1 Tax=Enhygromyxa salina TaxID=215803 RepID=A0A2S9YCE5_9BACT|nr:cytochrome c family protein [Enhygromyxa salina]PRQ02671.1 hypothetical protein ENSA7_55000 [Enhygromyxa salina]
MPRHICVFALLVFGCRGSVPSDTKRKLAEASPAEVEVPTPSPVAAAQTSYACSSTQQLTFGPAVPPDFSQVSSDQDADCFGWQEFIALNWPADGQGGFGDPGDLSPLAWQGYMSNHQFFQPNGAPPPPWGTSPTITLDCIAEAGLDPANANALTALTMVTKFSSDRESSDAHQAAPYKEPAWLGDVSGHNVWYEVRLNEDEYNNLVANQLYSLEDQTNYYANAANPALALPMGAWTSEIGAMEVKAAWIEAENPIDDKWKEYKLTKAVVVESDTQKCRAMTVALVALHIIHKTETQPTWIWATFEHVDNTPDNSEAANTTKTWTFFDPNCAPKTVSNIPEFCQFKGQSEVTVGCDSSAWNQAPQYWIGEDCPDPVPVQVTRVAPIDANASAANHAAWQAVTAAGYTDSVWLNYQLVNVQWSTNPPTSQPKLVPLDVLSMQPDSNIANTVLETYIQDKRCVDCHRKATIAGSETLPSDFSFLLQEAKSSGDIKDASLAGARSHRRRIIE